MTKLLILTVLLWSPSALAQRYLRGVRVSAPPPAYRAEVPPPSPSPRHHWIAGYWAARAGKHVWLGGHWALPPGPNYIWEPARWVDEGGAQVFYDGHWRPGEDPDPYQAYQPPPPPVQETVTEVPPPPPPEEVRPPSPFG